MNLKYYLRGLGLGIAITAIILGIAADSRKASLSDEDIIIKAKNLGMIEDTQLAGYVQEEKVKWEQEIREDMEAGNSDQAEQGLGEKEDEAIAEPLLFTVKEGETPMGISERLEAGGLVPSAADFNQYLADNEYDRKIVPFDYTIPPNADMETIARIITGHKVTETLQSAE